ncbi:3-oxoacyl-[acyl-carrier-protein] reductase FabG [Paraburkholderia rhynchosiae]|uniref:3-oxoacyl-[acyl-carrier-protein] reductase FabG n=1 Tax=Paraburkholderia rhynchosiae TaxID=487049 RepID=A0A6J5CVA6_9BURK|nr:3-oxoacyl-[acyl-carrier-protein] reductase FabG [Paraburkholderia rhynchosiae]
MASKLGLDGKAILQTNVTDRNQVKARVDRAVELHGRILLNNAGLMPSSMLDRLKIDEWDRMIDVNIKGVLYGIGSLRCSTCRRRKAARLSTSRLSLAVRWGLEAQSTPVRSGQYVRFRKDFARKSNPGTSARPSFRLGRSRLN